MIFDYKPQAKSQIVKKNVPTIGHGAKKNSNPKQNGNQNSNLKSYFKKNSNLKSMCPNDISTLGQYAYAKLVLSWDKPFGHEV